MANQNPMNLLVEAIDFEDEVAHAVQSLYLAVFDMGGACVGRRNGQPYTRRPPMARYETAVLRRVRTDPWLQIVNRDVRNAARAQFDGTMLDGWRLRRQREDNRFFYWLEDTVGRSPYLVLEGRYLLL